VQRVLDLLRDTDLPVQSIAEQTGFASLHTLSRQVRAATGHGPGSYRALFR
jgi:transcriptional regulator GlxA family with amidase domain